MAGRGGAQIKDYRIPVHSVKEWLKHLEDPRLLVVEVYNSYFGQCSSFLPSIQNIMLQVDDADEKVRWLSINVSKIEQDARQQLQEEAKKKREQDDLQKRKVEMERLGDDEVKRPTGAKPNGGAEAKGRDLGESDDFARLQYGDNLRLEAVTIPRLERYTGYDNPRPLFLIMKDGEIKYEINYPNPPKISRIVTCLARGEEPDAAELASMDFRPNPDRVRRKAPRRKQAQEDEAKRKASEEKSAASRAPEEQRKLLLSVALQVHIKPDSKADAFPLVAVFGRTAPAGDFDKFLGATERNKTPMDPVFFHTFELDPALLTDPAPDSFGAEAEFLHAKNMANRAREFKIVVYDFAADVVIPSLKPEELQQAFAGSAIVNLKQIMEATEFAATDGAAAGQPAFASFELENKSPEMGASPGTLLCNARLSKLRGKTSRLRLRVTCKNLPVQQEVGRIDPLVAVSVQDANSVTFCPVATTEIKRNSTNPAFAKTVVVDYYSSFERTVKVAVYDSDDFDWTYPPRGLIGWAAIPLSAFTVTVQSGDARPQHAPLLSAPIGTRSDVLQAALRNVRGEPLGESVVIHVDAVQLPPVQSKSSATTGDRLSASFRASGLRRADWKGAARPVVAVFTKSFELRQFDTLIGVTERAESADDANAPVLFNEDVLLGVPLDADDPKNSLRVAVYDVLQGQELAPTQGTLLGECLVDVQAVLRDGGLADVMLVDSAGVIIPRSNLSVQLLTVGTVADAEVAIELFNLPNSEATNKCDPIVACFKADGEGNHIVPIGRTEPLAGASDAVFAKRIPLRVFSKFAASYRFVVFDTPDPAVAGGGDLDAADIIGEFKFTASDSVEAETTLPLVLHGEELKDCFARVTIYPVVKASPQLGGPSTSTASAASAAAAGAAAAAKAAAPGSVEAALAVPQNVSFALSCRSLPKLPNKATTDPLVVVYRKNPDNSGTYTIVLQSDWLRNQTNPNFNIVVSLPFDPATPNVYRFTVFDVDDDNRITENDIVCSAKLDLRDVIAAAAKLGGGAQGKAAVVPFEQRMLSRKNEEVAGEGGKPTTLVMHILNDEEVRVRVEENEKKRVAGEAKAEAVERKGATAVAFTLACKGLPKLAGRDKCSPIVVLYRQSAEDAANYGLAGKTDLFTNEENPVYKNPFSMELTAGANMVRLSVFDVENPDNVTDQDLLCFAEVDIAQLAQYAGDDAAGVELAVPLLLANGEPALGASGEPSLIVVTPIAGGAAPTGDATAAAADGAESAAEAKEAST